ncbi:MAG: hypothetical protein U1E65_22150 [Myxococcota bacterium]
MANFHVQYERSIDGLVGGAAVDTPLGRIPVVVTVPLRPIARMVAELLFQRVMGAAREEVSGDEVGFFGFLQKAWDSVWGTAKKVARAIGLTKLVRAVKSGIQKVVGWAGSVVRSPVFGAIVGVATLIPGVGPIAAAGYAGVKAAMAIADGASRGDPKALETIGKYALPGGEKAMALIRSVAPT